MAAVEKKLTKTLCKVFINVSDTADNPVWRLIDEPVAALDIAMDPETESQDYCQCSGGSGCDKGGLRPFER